MTKNKPKLSFLMSVFSDRNRQLEISLYSLTSHSYSPDDVELLVFIDFIKPQAVLEILKKYRKYFSKLTVFCVTSKKNRINHSASRRNFLATKAIGRFIVFSEPEMLHLENTIEQFLMYCNGENEQSWISGPVYAGTDMVNESGKLVDETFLPQSLELIEKIIEERPKNLGKSIVENKEFALYFHLIDNEFYPNPMFCTMFNRHFFLNIGGFNQQLLVRGYEENELAKRFKDQQGRIIIDPNIKTIHIPHRKIIDKESQVSWNLYNSTVFFNPQQKIGKINDANFETIRL